LKYLLLHTDAFSGRELPNGTIELRKAVELFSRFDCQIQSWDMAFKDTMRIVRGGTGPCRARGGSLPAGSGWRPVWIFPGTLLGVRQLSARWPDAQTKLVEDRADGPTVDQSLRHQIGGFVAVNPQAARSPARRQPVHSLESGKWYLPHPMLKPCVEGFKGEYASFPMGPMMTKWTPGVG